MSEKPKSNYWDEYRQWWREEYDPVTIEKAMYGNPRDKPLPNETRGCVSPLGNLAQPAQPVKGTKR